MPTMKFFALIFALFASAIFASTFPEEEGVLVLGADNFDEAIQEHKNILVEFYAPWCGHCKALAPEYAKAAKALGDSPVKLAKVDATVHNDLGKNFGVKGFPTLKFFKNGKASDYTGGRTEKEIVNWLNKKVGPATATIASEADLAKFQENNDAFVVGVFASAESEEAKVFKAAADGDELHIYAIATDASVKSKLGVSDNTVVVLKSYDDLRNDLSVNGETTSEDVTKFVGKFSTPWIQEFSQETSKKIFGSPITKHVLFFTNKAADHHKTTLEAYQSVAKEHLGELLFVNIPSTEKKVLEFFDVKEDALPTMILADLGAESGIKKYPFSGKHESAAINAFIGEFKAGKLQAHLKSEEVAPEDTAGDVIVVKGKSFNDLVVNNDKDVLVEFYAPWCGHCKQLAPTYEELAKTVKAKSSNVVIAKMDATANEVDHPNVSVRGFPTIYFFKGNDKQNPVKYEEKRELEDFLEFLENNVHHKWSNDEL